MKDIFKEKCFAGMPRGNHSFNYYFMPKVYDKVTQGATNKMNAMVKELEKRNLISIHRRKTFDESTGKFKSFNNVYFRPCDKEHICNWFKIDLEQTNK